MFVEEFVFVPYILDRFEIEEITSGCITLCRWFPIFGYGLTSVEAINRLANVSKKSCYLTGRRTAVNNVDC